MLRVAFVNHHGGVPSGAEQTLEAYLHRVPDDIEPHVFLFEEGAFADRLRAANILVHVLPASQELMAVKRESLHVADALRALRHALRLYKLLRQCRADVVVTNTMKAHIVGSFAAWLCGTPVVTCLHDLPDGLALKVIRAISRVCASERITCSKAVARRFALPRTTALIPPLDLNRFAELPSREDARALLGLPHEKLIFSIVGRVARWKGQDRFLQAAARASSRSSNVHFAIVGSPTFQQDYSFAPEMIKLAAELGIPERVSFIPWLEDPRIAYAASDLVCNASVAEPFGRTSAEAAACGVPTLCFDDGGASEAALHAVTGTIVPAGDVEAFAAAMVAYATDPAALRRAGVAARVYSERHDADRLACTFFEIVRRASSKAAPSTAAVPAVRIAEPARPMATVDR